MTDVTTSRTDVKPATQEIWSQVVWNLRTHFGDNRELRTVTEADAEEFHRFLIAEELAAVTIQKRLQHARGFFNVAKKRRTIATNSFAGVTLSATPPEDRKRFVSRADIDKLLAVCGPTWHTIIGLARFGGLRCPSEVLSLRWQDVDFAAERIVVQSPKTERYGKARRTISMFPELKRNPPGR